MTAALTARGIDTGLFQVVGMFGQAVHDVLMAGGRITPIISAEADAWTTDDEDLADAVAAKVRATVGWADVVAV